MRTTMLREARWPRVRRSRLLVCAATVTLAAGLAGYTISGAAAGTRPPAAAGSAVAAGAAEYNAATGTTVRAQPQPLPQTRVTLLTGDRAELSTAPDGQQTVSPVTRAGSHAARGSSGFTRFTWGGDQYLVPDEAAPYLASGVLDPRLFDVSYLVQARFGAALPVQVSYTGPAVPRLPGLNVSHAAGGVATGTLATAQALSLGRLLAGAQASALARHTRPGLLPGISRISLAPPSGVPPLPASPTAAAPGQLAVSAAAAQHGLAYHTLTLKFTAPGGGAATAIGFVQNLADSNLAPGGAQAGSSGVGPGVIFTEARGTYRVTLPDGTYSAEFSIVTPHSGTILGYDAALVTDPQFTVKADTTVTLNAHAAVPYRATLSGVTAPPVQTDEIGFERASSTGPAGGTGGTASAGTIAMGLMSVSGDGYTASRLSASPTGAVSTGRLGFQATAWLGAKPFGGAEPKSTYILYFPSQGRIPASLGFTVAKADLTAYHENLYANPLGTCGNSDSPTISVYQPAVDAATEWQYSVPPGGTRTDYWYDADPRLDLWQPQLISADCSTPAPNIELQDSPRQIRQGGQVSETWSKAPLAAPQAVAPADPYAGGPLDTMCSACRQGDGAFVSIPPYGDSDPAHNSFTNAQSLPSAVQFYQDGKRVIVPGCSYNLETGALAGCQLAPYDLELPLLPRAASYRLNWAYQGWSSDTVATSTVDWAFRSAPDPAAGKLPGHEECPPIPSQGCSYLPLLFIGYDLALNHAGQAPAGQSFPVNFTVTHQQGEAPPSGLSATVSASFDNGKTWTTPQTAASQGGGKFTVKIQQPALSATSKFVSLRVTARDAAGDTVTETLIKAYGLTS